MRTQLGRSSGKHSPEQDTIESEASLSASDADESPGYTGRSGETSRSTRDLTSKSIRSNPKARRQEDSRAKISTQVDKEISRLEKERADEALFTLDVPSSRRGPVSKAPKSEVPRYTTSKSARKQPNTSKQRVKRVMMEDVSGPIVATEQTKPSMDVEDLTLLSVIDVSTLTMMFLI